MYVQKFMHPAWADNLSEAGCICRLIIGEPAVLTIRMGDRLSDLPLDRMVPEVLLPVSNIQRREQR